MKNIKVEDELHRLLISYSKLSGITLTELIQKIIEESEIYKQINKEFQKMKFKQK